MKPALLFHIKKQISVLFQSAKGWAKELNLISWNDKEAKYDLREWDAAHEKMGKGVTLRGDELKKFKDLVSSMERNYHFN